MHSRCSSVALAIEVEVYVGLSEGLRSTCIANSVAEVREGSCGAVHFGEVMVPPFVVTLPQEVVVQDGVACAYSIDKVLLSAATHARELCVVANENDEVTFQHLRNAT